MTDFLTEKRQEIADRLKGSSRSWRSTAASRPPLRHSESWGHRLTPPRPPSPPPLAADRDAQGEAPNVRARQPQPLLRRPLRPPPRSKQHRKKRCGKVAVDGGKAAARAPPRPSRPCRDSRASRSPSWRPRWASRRPTSTGCCLDWRRRGRWRRKVGGGIRGRGEERARSARRHPGRPPGRPPLGARRRLTWPIPRADALSFVR